MKNNTPAFPTPRFMVDKDARFNGFSVNTDGMSLRDYFAAKAMQSLLTTANGVVGVNRYEHRVAETALAIADAMLKAREA